VDIGEIVSLSAKVNLCYGGMLDGVTENILRSNVDGHI